MLPPLLRTWEKFYMRRLESLFAELRTQKKKALAAFVTAGDPSVSSTAAIVKGMVSSGADIVELGVPYSDPIAEGAVIQAANVRALSKGIIVGNLMQLVRGLRDEGVEKPILYLLYYNVIFQYGIDRFVSDCAHSGVDGLIIPDLPFEEQDELRPVCDKYKVDLISLVTPVSGGRMQKIVRKATGFIYCVSSLGVTGIRNEFSTDFTSFINELTLYSGLPKLIGFGISSPEQVRYLKNYADGVIVGSAIVSLVASSKSDMEAVAKVNQFVASLRNALDT